MVALISVDMGELLGCEPRKSPSRYQIYKVPNKSHRLLRPKETEADKAWRKRYTKARRKAAELLLEHKARLDQASVNELVRMWRDEQKDALRRNNEVCADESEIMVRMPRSFYLPPERDRWLGNRDHSPHYLGKRRQGRKQGRRPWRDLQR